MFRRTMLILAFILIVYSAYSQDNRYLHPGKYISAYEIFYQNPWQKDLTEFEYPTKNLIDTILNEVVILYIDSSFYIGDEGYLIDEIDGFYGGYFEEIDGQEYGYTTYALNKEADTVRIGVGFNKNNDQIQLSFEKLEKHRIRGHSDIIVRWKKIYCIGSNEFVNN